jgi:multicomponent Na+:H+ antiporter subunit C
LSVLAYLVAVWLLLAGIYGVVTSRHLVHLVTCLSVAQASTYVLLLAIGYKEHGTAPIFKDLPAKETARAVDPVVQALTLTDIVVGVTVLALLLALVVKAHDDTGTLDPDELCAMKG